MTFDSIGFEPLSKTIDPSYLKRHCFMLLSLNLYLPQAAIFVEILTKVFQFLTFFRKSINIIGKPKIVTVLPPILNLPLGSLSSFLVI